MAKKRKHYQLQGNPAADLIPPFANGLPSPSKFFRLGHQSPPFSSSSSLSPSSPSSSFSPSSPASSSLSPSSPSSSYSALLNKPSQSAYNSGNSNNRVSEGRSGYAKYTPSSSSQNNNINRYNGNSRDPIKYTTSSNRPQQSPYSTNNKNKKDLYASQNVDPYSKITPARVTALNDPDKLAAPFLSDASFIPGKNPDSKPPLPANPQDVRENHKRNQDSSSLSQIFFKNMKGNPASAVLPSGGFKKEFDESLLGSMSMGSIADAMAGGQDKTGGRNDYTDYDYDNLGNGDTTDYDYGYADADQKRNGQNYNENDDYPDYYDEYDYPKNNGGDYDYNYDYVDDGYGKDGGNRYANGTGSSTGYKTPENYDRETTKSYHVGKDTNDKYDNQYKDYSQNRDNDYDDYSPDDARSISDYYDYSNPSDDYYSESDSSPNDYNSYSDKPSDDYYSNNDKSSNDYYSNNDKSSNDYHSNNDKSSNDYYSNNDKSSNDYHSNNDKSSNNYYSNNDKSSNDYHSNNDKSSNNYYSNNDKAASDNYSNNNKPSYDYYSDDDDNYYDDLYYEDNHDNEKSTKEKSSSYNPTDIELNTHDVVGSPINEDEQGKDESSHAYYPQNDIYHLDPDEDVGKEDNALYQDAGFIANNYGNNKDRGPIDSYGYSENANFNEDKTEKTSSFPSSPSDPDYNVGDSKSSADQDILSSRIDNSQQTPDEPNHSTVDNPTGSYIPVEPGVNTKIPDDVAPSNTPKTFIGPIVSNTNLFIEPVDENPLIILPTSISNKNSGESNSVKSRGPQPFKRPA